MKNLFRKVDFVKALHLISLWLIAITLPLFDILSRNATFFIANHFHSVDIVIFIFSLCILLPVLPVLLVAGTRLLSARAGDLVHALFIGVFITLIFFQFGKHIPGIPAVLIFVLAPVLGIFYVVFYKREYLTSFTTALTPSIVVIPLYFIVFSPFEKIVFPSHPASAYSHAMSKTPIIMVIFDELSLTSLMDTNRQIDSVRYPHFSSLVHDSYWFRNATTVYDQTELAVPAILTGKRPPLTGKMVPTLADFPDNLFTLLGNSYRMNVSECLTRLCPPEYMSGGQGQVLSRERWRSIASDLGIIYLHLICPTDVEGRLPAITRNWGEFTGLPAFSAIDRAKEGDAIIENRVNTFRSIVGNLRSDSIPQFIFIHTLLPHIPWEYLPSGHRYSVNLQKPIPGLDPNTDTWSDDENLVYQGCQKQLLQTGFVDLLLGEFIQKLKSVGLYDQSLVIITADHGVSYRPGDSRRHLTATNYPDILPIPLFVKCPHQTYPIISERNVETIDIVPTISSITGIQVPWKTDGVSALEENIPERAMKLASGMKWTEYRQYPPSVYDKYEYPTYQRELYGTGSFGRSFYRGINRFRDMVGSRLSEIKTEQGGYSFILNEQEFYSVVDTNRHEILSEISGELRDLPDNQSYDIAISVNGMVEAVTRSYLDGTIKYSALVAEDRFHQGYNQVNLGIINEKYSGKYLLLPKNSIRYSLLSRGGKEILIGPEGKSIPIAVNELQGTVDTVRLAGTRLLIGGWSADLIASRLPKTFAVFVGEHFLSVGSCGTNIRDDLAITYNLELLRSSGFIFENYYQTSNQFNQSDVHVFAISGRNVATELVHDFIDRSSVVDQRYSPVYHQRIVDTLIRWDGKRVPVIQGKISGAVDRCEFTDSTFAVAGWAVDLQKSQAAKCIAICSEENHLVTITADIVRPDLIIGMKNEEIHHGGFNCILPKSRMEMVRDISRLHFYAISGEAEYASEIYSPTDITRLTQSIKYVFKRGPGGAGYFLSDRGDTINTGKNIFNGNVDLLQITDDSIDVVGWALEKTNYRPANSVFIVLGNRDVIGIQNGILRPDLSRMIGNRQMVPAGFTLHYRIPQVRGIPLESIHVFAYSRERKIASELSIHK